MKLPYALSRRRVLQAMIVPLIGAPMAGAAAAPRGSVLVAYFSRSGNTRLVAGQIQCATGAALFEIAPETPYPEDYEQTVDQAQRERERRYLPPLRASVPNMAAYQTVYLGFPVWGQTVPPVIRSFLSHHDLAGKTLIPFITHGGFGIGDSLAVVAADAPTAALRGNGLAIQMDQEKQILQRVTGWLGDIAVPGPRGK
jgi:flavodoxin